MSIALGAILMFTPGGQAFLGAIFSGIVAGVGGTIVGMSHAAFQVGMAAVAGGIMGAANAAMAGGDLGDVLRGAAVGAISGAITSGLGNLDNPYSQLAGKAVVGGASNAAMGGKFQDGFISSAVTSAVAPQPINANDGVIQITSKVAIAGIIGGKTSKLGGGKFANGATSGAFQYMIAPANHRMGAFNGIAGGIGGMINARSLGDFGRSMLQFAGLPSDLLSGWDKSSSGGMVPKSMQDVISDVGGREAALVGGKNLCNVNGHHGWHAGTNAGISFNLGIGLGIPLLAAFGVGHETIDFSKDAVPAEFRNQGLTNQVLDGITDVFANTFGTILGLGSFSYGNATGYAAKWGNWIPGPTDSDKSFGGDGSTYAGRKYNASRAWGQNPRRSEFW